MLICLLLVENCRTFVVSKGRNTHGSAQGKGNNPVRGGL
mgnify:CR=1 FL=1|jgi:hypothetical protein